MEDVSNDVNNSADTSVGTETSSSTQSQSEGVEQNVQAQQSQGDSRPFHEHPRFQELIQQKNEQAQRLAQYEETIKGLQSRFDQMQPKQQQGPAYQQLMDRLKGIDPEFAQFQSKIAESMEYVPQLQSELHALKIEKARNEAESRLDALYKEHKITDDRKDFYRAAIENMAYNNPKSSLNDISSYFKSTHEKLSKWFDVNDRKQRESYVTDKRKDQTPASATGGATVSPGQSTGADKPKRLTDPSVVKMVADELRRAKQKI